MTQFAISIDQTAVPNNKTTTIKCQGRCHVDIMVLSLHLNHCINRLMSVVVGLWCLKPLSTISVVSWLSVLLLGKTEYPEKTTNLSQVADKIHHIMLDRVYIS